VGRPVAGPVDAILYGPAALRDSRPAVHVHADDRLDRRLWWSIGLNGLIVIAEFVGGIASGSLSLLSDAVHNLVDVASLILAVLARRFARIPPSPRHTYGFRRLEVLAALANSVTLLVAVTLIVREAVVRFFEPRALDASILLPVAVVGLLANLGGVALLHRYASGSDLNVRSAFLHLVQDTLSSVVVVAVGLSASWRYSPYFDSIASILVAAFVLRAGWTVFREAFSILMEATPPDLDIVEIARECERRCGLASMHHVHVWETAGGERLLTAHVCLSDRALSEVEAVLRRVRRLLAERWGIEHATLEPEFEGCGSEEVLDRAGHRLGATIDALGDPGPVSCPSASEETGLRAGRPAAASAHGAEKKSTIDRPIA